VSTLKRRLHRIIYHLWDATIPLLDPEQIQSVLLLEADSKAGRITYMDGEDSLRSILKLGWRRHEAARILTQLRVTGSSNRLDFQELDESNLDKVETRLKVLVQWNSAFEKKQEAYDWLRSYLRINPSGDGVNHERWDNRINDHSTEK